MFDIKVHSETDERIRKIYSIPHQTLKGNARWALGIVTGNNEAHLQAKRSKTNEPIYKGSDVEYYRLKSSSNFIKYNRDSFQQVAKDEFYRCEEKLIYKFISNKLVFAYDDKKSLTLNSANILIPEIPGMHIKVVLAFLNSSVFQFLFEKKFSTHKVLRSDLEELPFPNVSKGDQGKIIGLVDRAIKGEEVRGKIDEVINSYFV
ncbi:MAG: hypothetical protein IPP51_12050 [Bacteroidetes bacterium]|nr:hypothetical protein [Bacteroidota bacterium]